MKNYNILKIDKFYGAVLVIDDEMTENSNKILAEKINKISIDKKIEFLILEINSLGGAAEGVYEIANKIKALKIPVIAYILQSALSGAYWVAVAADFIYLKTPLCAVGSVGVYSTFVETSEQLKKQGLTLEIIKKGKFKAETTGFIPLTEAGREQLQERIDLIYDIFSKFVIECRGEIKESYLQAQAHYGVKAIKKNFADVICSPEEVLIKILTLLNKKE